MRLTDYDPMVVAAGSLLYGGIVLLPFALVIDHPWTLRPTAEALAARWQWAYSPARWA